MNTWVTKYVIIRNNIIYINGIPTYTEESAVIFKDFIRAAYKNAGIAYPKFYKMDDLCKLALLASEYLLKDIDVIEKYGKEFVGVVFQNASSTIDTDTVFQNTIDDRNNYFPSPAVFVYTLPNIMTGEICIKHKIYGENLLLIEPRFNPASLSDNVDMLLAEKRSKVCIAGWVEQNGENYEAFLYIAEHFKHDNYGLCMQQSEYELTKIYNSNK